jgi:hypothetical protein
LNFQIRKEYLLAGHGAGGGDIGCGLRGGKTNHAAGGERQQHKSHKNTTQKLRICLDSVIQNSSPPKRDSLPHVNHSTILAPHKL